MKGINALVFADLLHKIEHADKEELKQYLTDINTIIKAASLNKLVTGTNFKQAMIIKEEIKTLIENLE